MYHVVGTTITVTLIYLLSFFFYRAGLYQQSIHRKFWNTILALSFLMTALAGIFMALQINFKWDIPFIKSIIKWHVETGIVLGLTGVFHLIWHLSYFGKIFKESDKPGVLPAYVTNRSYSISSNLFMIGFTSTSVQILLIRELMNVAGGYELISGMFLASWLITSAAGAAIAGRSALDDIRKINLIFAAGPFLSVILLVLLTRLFMGTGEVPSFLSGMIMTLILLTPFCLISGFAFVRLITHARENKGYVAGRSFSIETAGGIVAGILLVFLTSGLLNTYELLLIIILLFLAYVILTFYIQRKSSGLVIRILFTIIISAAVISEPDIFFRQLLLPGIKVTETRDTPYGNITKGEYSGEQSIYYNQKLLSYQDDIVEREEDIHYALLQLEQHKSILMISGSLSSHLPEILKYNVAKVTFVESDPELARSGRSDLSTGPTQVETVTRDAYRFIRDGTDIFDAILMLLPPPATLSINRYYTTVFFEYAKQRLDSGGVFICSPGPNDNYFNQESINLYSSIYNSLVANFRYVVPVAGNKLYFLASDEILSVSFCRLAAEQKIENVYVGPSFLSDDLMESRSAEIASLMDPSVRLNRPEFPIACFHFQSYNFSKNLTERVPAIIIMVIAFIIPVLAVRRRNLLMYFGASALAGFEIIILLTLQLTAGNIYQLTGLVIAGMMAGLAVGAGTGIKSIDNIDLRIKAIALVIYYIAVALIFNFILTFKGTLAPAILIVFSVVIPSWMTGHIFRELTLINSDPSATGATYSADLAGSALGFILISGVAIPAYGIRDSIVLLAVLVSVGILFGRKDKG